MAWIYLLLAIIFEVVGTTNMKLSKGFSKTLPSVLIFIFYGLSFIMLTLALRKIDLSMAYAIWAGLGTVFIVVIGMLWFKEPATFVKIASIGLIILGVVGLNLRGQIHQ